MFHYLIKGAVIASEATPDKNKLSTDTLTYSDIQNHADYSASSTGLDLKNGSISPNIGMPVSGDASSTTKSAIEAGASITITGNQKQDLSKLSRDTGNSLNVLGKIFDKKTVQEKQELAKVFGEEAFKAVGDLAESMRKKATTKEEKAKWSDGGEYKVLLHAVAGGIMSDLGGNGFATGVASAGLNEAVQGQLAKITDRGLHQLASAAIGAVAAKIVGGNAQVGAATAVSGTKNNYYRHRTHQPGEYLLVKSKDDGQYHWWIVGDDGEDHISDDNPPKAGKTFWFQDGDHLASSDDTMGWEYQKGDGGLIQDHEVDVNTISVFGKPIIGIVDDHGYKQGVELRSKVEDYSDGMGVMAPLVGTGGSGSLIKGAIDVEKAAAAAKAIEEAAAAAKAADAKAAEEAAAVAKAAEETKAAQEAADAKAAQEAADAAKATQESGNAVELSRTQSVNLERLNNIVDEHLTDMDFSGTLRDLQGNPVPKPGGGYWNHLQEMKDSYSGLLKIKRGLEGSLKNPNLSDGARQALQNGLDKANSNISKIEDLFKPFGGI